MTYWYIRKIQNNTTCFNQKVPLLQVRTSNNKIRIINKKIENILGTIFPFKKERVILKSNVEKVKCGAESAVGMVGGPVIPTDCQK